MATRLSEHDKHVIRLLVADLYDTRLRHARSAMHAGDPRLAPEPEEIEVFADRIFAQYGFEGAVVCIEAYQQRVETCGQRMAKLRARLCHAPRPTCERRRK